MKKLIISAATLFLISCAAYKPPTATTIDAARAGEKFPGTSTADLNEGKAIFQENCRKCHSLKRPFKHTDEEISKVLPKMAKKAKLDDRQEQLVLKYLLTMNDVRKE